MKSRETAVFSGRGVLVFRGQKMLVRLVAVIKKTLFFFKKIVHF